MADAHEPYGSAVFVRKTGVICRNTSLVATLDEQQVDYTISALIQKKTQEALIMWMGVREDQRRNGFGSIFIAELLAVFSTLGVRTVRFTVWP